MVNHQEEIDARLAKQLAERIEQEEQERQRADEEIARKLQEREELKITEQDPSTPHYQLDMNSVGLPLPTEYQQHCSRVDPVVHNLRLCSLNEVQKESREEECAPVSEEEARRIQEEQDAEFARMLQEQEGRKQCSMLDQDRLIAIEAQDKELARLLQERERAKAKRARERGKQKALLKKQQQRGVISDDEVREEEFLHPPHSTAVRPTDLDLSGSRVYTSRVKQRFPDPEMIEVLPCPEPGPSHGLPNIAMAIDPTYPRRALSDTPPSNVSSPAISLPPPDFEDDDIPVPPYMPIQGQRRSASLEKKSRKGRVNKDSCKQQ